MLPPVEIEPKASNFNALHATIWDNSLKNFYILRVILFKTALLKDGGGGHHTA